MVSNTVGIATFAEEKIRACDTPTPLAVPRPIEHTAYFWKTDPAASGGAPQPVFTIPPQNGCAPTDQRLWPIAGVTFVPPSSSTAGTWDAARVKLIVLVDVVCLHEGEAAEALGFGEYDTALVVVHNPLDMPNTWRYEFKLFANPAAGKLKWLDKISSTYYSCLCYSNLLFFALQDCSEQLEGLCICPTGGGCIPVGCLSTCRPHRHRRPPGAG